MRAASLRKVGSFLGGSGPSAWRKDAEARIAVTVQREKSFIMINTHKGGISLKITCPKKEEVATEKNAPQILFA
jgi:hypothetical protein